MYLRLYGIVTTIEKEGEFKIGVPIFKGIYKKSGFYNMNGEEIDIEAYGEPKTLPAAKRIIGDGKNYIVLYNPKQDCIPYAGKTAEAPCISTTKEIGFPNGISVGILFPNKIILAPQKGIKDDELLQLYNICQ